ncbi:DUF692 domain-containing protein [Kitasatospora purpeofusca]|uniref:DUF692 domain-containing protein n=1 Tax=Kitasatospora purpeofusca TaxID=67352 RepID=UPI002255A68A|nr:DUF692 domain-containing protein [Kitasatospora purpeofusca]MCX4753385.1 DUF692 domain-containing protein [Kitasatospora purpeofusca]WSR32890.1 DUF692 domain-containing protein [Kitasatospora purpeofusca]
MSTAVPELGTGIGYREPIHEIATDPGLVEWVEVISEHYMGATRKRESIDSLLERIPEIPVVPHGIEMSIGSVGDDGRWDAYLEELAAVVEGFDAPWFSDHLCFTRTSTAELGTLLPLPRTRESARHVARRARRAVERVGRPFLLENIAYHFSWGDELTEAQFVTEIVEASGCHLLLDLTNLTYNARNHGFDALDFIREIPYERVVQVHLAGGVEEEGTYFDTHSMPVPEPVWELLGALLEFHPVPAVMLERDQRLDRTEEIATDLRRATELRRTTDRRRTTDPRRATAPRRKG